MALRVYPEGVLAVAKKQIDLLNDDIRALIVARVGGVDDRYVSSHKYVNDLISQGGGCEITASGYSRTALAGKTVAIDGSLFIVCNASNTVFPAMASGQLMVAVATYFHVGSDVNQNILLSYYDGGSAPNDLPAGGKSTNGGTLTVDWHDTGGWYRFSPQQS